MAKYLVVSTSGNPDSNSRRMGRIAFRRLEKAGVKCEWLDISELGLPLCDADTCYAQPSAQKASKVIKAAEGILVATPVYNYDVSAAAKNLVELTGSSWEDKVVGFLCAAGGMSSYMSVMSFASSLMLDFRCVIIPRFVYATGRAFEGDDLKDTEVEERIHSLADELVRFTTALRAEK
ncbi:MAG TPA: NAD(P)H-dependent oxidoreductase [Chthoniobacterales bacterium]|nr:NAD(P)H-dependent oxidoreductase [Chthoniobacterales bacterium]